MSAQKMAFCLAALALTACGSSVTPEDMELAKQQCAAHGGVKGVTRHERGNHITVVCASGILIEIKRHNEKATTP